MYFNIFIYILFSIYLGIPLLLELLLMPVRRTNQSWIGARDAFVSASKKFKNCFLADCVECVLCSQRWERGGRGNQFRENHQRTRRGERETLI